jgi:TPR repeat protein
MHYNGLGTAQDYKQAVYWYTKAAEDGDAKAQYYLGYMYANGHGVPQDHKETVYWYTKAATQDYAKAQYKLGHLYADAKGTPQDYIKAYTWYEIASDRGEKSAKNDRDEIAGKMTSKEIEVALSFVKDWLDGRNDDGSKDEIVILDNNTTLQKDDN